MRYTVDDSFISYRYAHNLVSGNGLVFNPGERVEGHSNFLWIVIIALFQSFGLNSLWVSKILGIFLSILNLLIIYRFSVYISGRKGFFYLLSLWLISLDIGFIRWSIAGLETQLFLCLLMLGVYYFALECETDRFPMSSIFFLLMSLARVEGPFIFLIALIYRIYIKRGRWASKDTIWTIIFLVLYFLYFSWRTLYYGSFLPNIYYAKTLGAWKQLIDGLVYIFAFIRDNGGILLFPIMLIPAVTRHNKAKYLYPFVGGYLIFIIYVGGDWMLDYRFFIPILPFIFILFQEGIRELSNTAFFKRRKFLLPTIVLLLIFSNFFNDYNKLFRSYFRQPCSLIKVFKGWKESPTKIYDRAKIGIWLKQFFPPNSLIAVEDCGMIPYYSELKTLDIVGILDPYVARLKGRMHRKYDTDYYFSRTPDCFILIRYCSLEEKSEIEWGAFADKAIYESEKFHKNYELIRAYYGKESELWFYIYKRR
ncbi:hypothetical protein KAW65_01230 [candidate division WOR-3 bacterium]|nr:hypothetical protein [candidate division WOR-3 bacterium]